MQTPPSELIVYACPTGALASLLDGYFTRSRELCGPNAAHSYPPHCTLTGFFHDDSEALPTYVAALAAALEEVRSARPAPPVTITDLALHEQFHGLLLESPWLKGLTANFADRAASPTRRDSLRLKDWLHLSLAYEFPPARGPELARLAVELVDLHAPVGWELRLYQRHPDKSWTCHASWPL
jgi:ubiquitin-associated SH3 domain-containing protein